jgi:hypothetical protein
MKNIDLPLHAIVHDDVAGFIDQGRYAKLEHALGVGDGDCVLHFQAGNAIATAFHREGGEISSNSDSDAFFGVGAKVSLR